jgi:hypothetical protein
MITKQGSAIDAANIGRLRALGAIHHVERHVLTLSKAFEQRVGGHNPAVMHKHVDSLVVSVDDG